MNRRFAVGHRTLKTALCVWICLEVFTRLEAGRGATAATAALICMQSTLSNTWKTGKERMVGTLFGGVMGMLFLALAGFVPPLSLNLAAAAGVVLIILLCNALGIQASCVMGIIVYLSLVLTTAAVSPLESGLWRMAETAFGIGIAWIVNRFLWPVSR